MAPGEVSTLDDPLEWLKDVVISKTEYATTPKVELSCTEETCNLRYNGTTLKTECTHPDINVACVALHVKHFHLEDYLPKHVRQQLNMESSGGQVQH